MTPGESLVPDSRCGYEWDPEWLDNPEVETNFQHCCFRETWGQNDRCFWHMNQEKSIDDLRRAATAHDCDLYDVPGARFETEENRRLNRRTLAPEDGEEDNIAPQPSELLCGMHTPGVEFRDTFDWTGVWLNDGNLSGANLAGADLREIDAERVDFSEAVLQGANLARADLRVDASGADLRDATLSGASACVVDKVFASLPRPDFSGAHLAGADLSGANFSGADLTDARLTDADLRATSLEMASLERANCFDANLIDAKLYGAVLTSTQINRDTTFFGDEQHCVYHPPRLSARELLTAYSPFHGHFGEVPTAGTGSADSSDNTSESERAMEAAVAADGGEDTTPATGQERTAHETQATKEATNTALDGNTDDRFSKAAWTYRAIERLARQNSFPSLQSQMFLKRQRMQTRMHRRTGGALSGDYLFSIVSGAFIKHGEGYLRIVAWGALIVLAFALLFPFGGWIRPIGPGGQPEEPITWSRVAEDPALLWESVYYSTLTFTNLGFGDYQPTNTVGQALTVVQTASGAVLLALLVFVLGRRAAR